MPRTPHALPHALQEFVTSLAEAHEQVDAAISAALSSSKPAYLCLACNLPPLAHPTFQRAPVPYSLTPRASNPRALEAAAAAAAEFLARGRKGVAVAGPLLRK